MGVNLGLEFRIRGSASLGYAVVGLMGPGQSLYTPSWYRLSLTLHPQSPKHELEDVSKPAPQGPRAFFGACISTLRAPNLR